MWAPVDCVGVPRYALVGLVGVDVDSRYRTLLSRVAMSVRKVERINARVSVLRPVSLSSANDGPRFVSQGTASREVHNTSTASFSSADGVRSVVNVLPSDMLTIICSGREVQHAPQV